MEFVPSQDWVLARGLDAVGQAGLIVLTDSKPPTKAKVVAVGPGKKRLDGSREQMAVKVGDTIILPQGIGILEFTWGKNKLEEPLLLLPAWQINLIEEEE